MKPEKLAIIGVTLWQKLIYNYIPLVQMRDAKSEQTILSLFKKGQLRQTNMHIDFTANYVMYIYKDSFDKIATWTNFDMTIDSIHSYSMI